MYFRLEIARALHSLSLLSIFALGCTLFTSFQWECVIFRVISGWVHSCLYIYILANTLNKPRRRNTRSHLTQIQYTFTYTHTKHKTKLLRNGATPHHFNRRPHRRVSAFRARSLAATDGADRIRQTRTRGQTGGTAKRDENVDNSATDGRRVLLWSTLFSMILCLSD